MTTPSLTTAKDVLAAVLASPPLPAAPMSRLGPREQARIHAGMQLRVEATQRVMAMGWSPLLVSVVRPGEPAQTWALLRLIRECGAAAFSNDEVELHDADDDERDRGRQGESRAAARR